MRDDNRTIFHIDVNSAYLSWEADYRLRQGEVLDLRSVPSVIGGDESSRHGVVLAKSALTKSYGIKTGETLFSARRKCPELITVPARHDIYNEYSLSLINLLKEYSPCVEQTSVDECFLDYTNMEMHFGVPLEAAYTIKERIKNELGFTVNVGISTNKLLAKMAGELKKPDLVHTLYPEEIESKMWPLPVEELYMVGKVTAAKLKSKGILTIKDLAHTNVQLLRGWLNKQGVVIWNYANGIDNSPVKEEAEEVKGISNATTLPFDIKDRQGAYKVLLALVETVALRLRKAEFKAKVISVSFKTNKFITSSRQRTLEVGTDSTTQIYQIICQLFDELWKGEHIRLLGVAATCLCNDDFCQLSLIDEKVEKHRKLDKTIDEIRDKYGKGSVKRATLADNPSKPVI